MIEPERNARSLWLSYLSIAAALIVGVGIGAGFSGSYPCEPVNPTLAQAQVVPDTASESGISPSAGCGGVDEPACTIVPNDYLSVDIGRMWLEGIAFGIDEDGEKQPLRVNDDGSVNCKTVRRGP